MYNLPVYLYYVHLSTHVLGVGFSLFTLQMCPKCLNSAWKIFKSIDICSVELNTLRPKARTTPGTYKDANNNLTIGCESSTMGRILENQSL